MSANPNPENSSLSRLENASIFLVLVICAAVFVTAGSIVFDLVYEGAGIAPAALMP